MGRDNAEVVVDEEDEEEEEDKEEDIKSPRTKHPSILAGKSRNKAPPVWVDLPSDVRHILVEK